MASAPLGVSRWLVILGHPHTVHSVHNIVTVIADQIALTSSCRFIVFKSKFAVDLQYPPFAHVTVHQSLPMPTHRNAYQTKDVAIIE